MLDFAELNPEATNLDLRVDAAEEFDVTSRQAADAIAGAIDAADASAR